MKRRRPPLKVKLNPVKVWEYLDSNSMSQNELARLCGLSPGYFSQLMNGTRCPSAPVRRRLQQVMGIADFDELFILERVED